MSKLKEITKLVLSSIEAMGKENRTGQQTFELHWKDGVLVDCYETTRGKIKKVMKYEEGESQ